MLPDTLHRVARDFFAAPLVVVSTIGLVSCGGGAASQPTAESPEPSPTASAFPTFPQVTLTASAGKQLGALGSYSGERGNLDGLGFVAASALDVRSGETVRFEIADAETPSEVGVGIAEVDPSGVAETRGDRVLYRDDTTRYLGGASLSPGLTVEYLVDLPEGEYLLSFDGSFGERISSVSWGFHVRVVGQV